MIGEWCYFKSKFTPELCKDILDQGLLLPSKKAVMGVDVNNPIVNNEYRRSEIRFIEKNNNKFQFLFDEIWKLATIANNDFFRFHLSKIDYIQLAEYNGDQKDEYKKHHDVFWMNNDPLYHRKLSCVIQLSDPDTYTGGDFELYDLNEYPSKEELRQQGTVIFFPSFLTHAALPVTSGIRHSLAVWVDGPKWR